MTANEQIIAHAIPAPRILPAPPADSGIPRSRINVRQSDHAWIRTAEPRAHGPGFLLNLTADGHDAEVHLDTGWVGWVPVLRVSR